MVHYDPVSPLYEQTLQHLSELIAAKMTRSNVVVGMIGFGESAEFLSRATQYDILDDVQWFGTDSTANEKKITENEKASEFAQNVSFKALQFSADTEGTAYREIETKLFGKLGYLPSTYAFTAYDSVWILGLSVLDAGSTNPNDLALEVPSTITSYNGALGNFELNDAGDLVSDNYAIWSIVDGVWYKGNYAKNMESGLIEFVETDLEELSSEKTILEKSLSNEDGESPLLLNLLIVLIIDVSAITVFVIWRQKILSAKLKNSAHMQKIEPTPEPTPEQTPEPTPEPESRLLETKDTVKLLSSKEILQKSIETHSALMVDKEIDFLDSSIKDVKFESNEKQILEIFSNLIHASNHLVGSYGQIEIGVHDDQGMAFFVKDNGNGISKQEQEKIFDEDKGPLGLMGTKELVQEMGGKIWVESVSFVGTTFYFSIPVTPN